MSLAPTLATTPGGGLLAFALALPVLAMLLAFVVGGRQAGRIAIVALLAGLVLSLAIAAAVLLGGEALVLTLGGWAPPLGVALRADGISAVMLLTTSVVMVGTALFAGAQFSGPAAGGGESRASLVFWTLLLGLWGAMNAVLLGNDLFNLYVALELLTFAAMPLVCLDGRPETLAAALRYLFFALLGSLLYLLGVALLYGAYGTLDIVLLSRLARADAATLVAAGLMTAGLLAKTALFPLHLWLPSAHAGAPAAASAVLSALVVKAPFFLVLRLWFGVMPELATGLAPQILAGLGALAILFGSALALRQARLKLLVAYSTVAQIGYLFLMFPLAGGADATAAGAWTGGMLQAVSHALAKAAMFLGAGLIAEALGHDRLRDLGGAARLLPMTVVAFGLGGLSLMGLPPSGGFVAKWLLLKAAIETQQWWWGLVLLSGGLLTGGYVFRVLSATLGRPAMPLGMAVGVPLGRQAVVLVLAVFSVVLGLLPLASFGLVQVGRLAP
jgi:multicomponent Na+:H+ antiporter subunit D